jgi:ABC-type microcin C transport system permease subunit YejB
VLEFNWEILKAAYFSCSNWKTKTPVQAGWKSSYFDQVAVVYQSVDDSYWKDLIRYRKGQCWHWVWLSGLWAENLAQRGWSYKKILYYYYQDVNIRKSL